MNLKKIKDIRVTDNGINMMIAICGAVSIGAILMANHTEPIEELDQIEKILETKNDFENFDMFLISTMQKDSKNLIVFSGEMVKEPNMPPVYTNCNFEVSFAEYLKVSTDIKGRIELENDLNDLYKSFENHNGEKLYNYEFRKIYSEIFKNIAEIIENKECEYETTLESDKLANTLKSDANKKIDVLTVSKIAEEENLQYFDIKTSVYDSVEDSVVFYTNRFYAEKGLDQEEVYQQFFDGKLDNEIINEQIVASKGDYVFGSFNKTDDNGLSI